MAESLFNMVQARTQKVVSATPYFFVTCNNIMTLDNQSHINIHVYTIVDWTRVLYFGFWLWQTTREQSGKTQKGDSYNIQVLQLSFIRTIT